MQRQGLPPARQAEQSKGLKLRVKSDEDQGAYGEDRGAKGEDEDKRRVAKTKVHVAKTE